jgi:hypothetical protein
MSLSKHLGTCTAKKKKKKHGVLQVCEKLSVQHLLRYKMFEVKVKKTRKKTRGDERKAHLNGRCTSVLSKTVNTGDCLVHETKPKEPAVHPRSVTVIGISVWVGPNARQHFDSTLKSSEVDCPSVRLNKCSKHIGVSGQVVVTVVVGEGCERRGREREAHWRIWTSGGGGSGRRGV